MRNGFSKKLQLLKEPASYYSGLGRNSALQIPDKILMVFKGPVRMVSANVHHRFLFIINLKETINLIVDSRRFVLNKNQAMLVLPHQHHLFVYETQDVERLLITFEGCDIAEMQKFRESVFNLNEEFFETLELLAAEYLSQIKDPSSGNGGKAALILSILLLDLGRCSRKYSSRKLQNDSVTDLINRYIHINLSTSLSIEEIAEEFKYSASHLRLLYRKAMGISIGKYIRETKIHKACGYLGDSKTKISEIAKLCGYSSLYAFSHAFKNETGIYPADYRKKTSGKLSS